MYSYLKGTLTDIEDEKATIEASGVGYCLIVGTNFSSKAPALGTQLTIFTHLVTREDSMTLFGFLTKSERNLFLDVQTVSGIGPKLAITITSHLTPSQFAQAILRKDQISLSKIPGIGKKSAERLILELKDKVSSYSIEEADTGKPNQQILVDEAILALVKLGLPKGQAVQAVNQSLKARPDIDNVSLLLQLALSQKNPV